MEFILDSSSEQLRPARLIRRSKLIPGNKRIEILLLRSSRGVRPVQVMGFIQSWKVPGGFVSSQRGTCVVPRGIRTTTALGQLHLPEEACTFANGQRHGMDLGEESEESLEITRGSSSKQVLEFVQFQPCEARESGVETSSTRKKARPLTLFFGFLYCEAL